MLTRTQRKIAALTMAVVLLLSLGVVGVPWVRAIRSCHTFRVFCNHVRNGNWPAARALVAADSLGFSVKVGALDYGGIDITQDISSARPSLIETFRHNFAHPASGNVVYFGLPEGSYNHAELRGGRIWSIKIP